MKRFLQLSALAIGLTFAARSANAFVPHPNYCGDLCDTPGEQGFCIGMQGGVIARVDCFCTQSGFWAC